MQMKKSYMLNQLRRPEQPSYLRFSLQKIRILPDYRKEN